MSAYVREYAREYARACSAPLRDYARACPCLHMVGCMHVSASVCECLRVSACVCVRLRVSMSVHIRPQNEPRMRLCLWLQGCVYLLVCEIALLRVSLICAGMHACIHACANGISSA